MKIRIMIMMLCALAFTSAAFAQVQNGGFEDGTDPGSFTTVGAGGGNITGWTVTFGSVDYIGSYWEAAEGSRSIDMSGGGAGSISQTIATIPGFTYQVTFYMSGNPDGSPMVKTMTVSANGAMSQNYSYDISVGNTRGVMLWASNTYTFTATSNNTTLTFASTTDTAFGPALDNVSITNVSGNLINLFQPVPVTTSPGGTFTFGTTQIYLSCPMNPTGYITGPGGGDLIVDNYLTVNGMNVCPNGGSCFSDASSLDTGGPIENTFSGVAPIDISSLLISGNNLYTFNLIDEGVIYGSSEINLATSCTQVYPVCHKDSGKKMQKTIYVGSLNAVNAHVTQHDDTPGPCTAN